MPAVIQKLETVDRLDRELTIESDFILYSNIHVRNERCIYLVEHEGERVSLLGSYLQGVPFHAFTFRAFGDSKRSVAAILQVFKAELGFEPTQPLDGIVTVAESAMRQLELPVVKGIRQLELMKLQRTDLLLPPGRSRLLEAADLVEVNRLSREASLMTFRDEELAAMPHLGLFDDTGALVSMAGFHTFDKAFVELGNIATSAAYRKQGLGAQITSDICRVALEKTAHVYLCVFADNPAASHMYRKIGFDTVETYAFLEIAW
ncbi:UNVERIFIED_CONTAM: ribosomal protein S18 acetylase RimI-like enzyme [Brevibacillus sp. OAP136]